MRQNIRSGNLKTKERVKSKMSRATLCKLSIIYMYLPIALMIVGWCSFWFFIPATQILVWVVFNTLEKQQSKESITFKKWEILLGLVLLILAVYYSGWGGLVPQSSDWPKHNAVLRDLMVRTWPVIYHNHDMVSMLTYYLGQYIVPAAVGKLLLLLFPQAITLETAFVVSEVVMALWNMIGLALVICHLFHLVGHGSFKILVMAAFLLFGNPLVLGKLLYMGMGFSSDLNNYHWLTYDYLMAQYSTNFVLMRWTFPQCIVPWIVMAMLMEGDNDVDSYVVIGLPVILFATFPFLAIVIYMIVLAVKKFLSQNDKKAFLLKCFSKENLLCFLSLGTFSFCYYISYFLTKEKPESLKLSFVFSWSRQFLVTYGVFVVFTFGLYAILLLKYEKKNLFLNSSIVILLVLPLFQVGVWNDFVRGVSIRS